MLGNCKSKDCNVAKSEHLFVTDRNHAHKILIVASDRNYRRSLFRVLANAKYNVYMAQTLVEAFEFMSQMSFAVILFDMIKPYEGGLSDLKSLMAASGAARVIVLSSFNEKGLRNSLATMGLADFLVKPSKKTSILQAVENALPVRNA